MEKEMEIERAEIWISHILRWGVVLCAVVIAFGWILSSNPMIMAGLLMLICLPILRVFAAGVIFLRQRDYIYVGLSLFVFLILVASMMLGQKL
jgi:uncharacterized membrane protein